MQIVVNGKNEILPAPCTVAEFVERFGAGNIPCAVEVNERLVAHDRRATVSLQAGDRIEIVTLVGGG